MGRAAPAEGRVPRRRQRRWWGRGAGGPLPAPAISPDAPHSGAWAALGGTLCSAGRWRATRAARGSDLAPVPAAPATNPPPSRRRGDVRPAGPPTALPDPAALSPTSSAASLAGRPGSKRADTGKFWGREGRALKGPRPLFTGGVGEPRRYRSWNGVGRLSCCDRSGVHVKCPPVAWGSRGSFLHLLSVLEINVDMYVVHMSKQAQRPQGARAAKCQTSEPMKGDVCVLI